MSTDLFSSSKPLSDPVRVASRLVQSIVLVSLAIYLVQNLLSFQRVTEPTVKVILLAGMALTLVVGFSFPIAMGLLLRDAGKRPVFYLRSFRSDRETVRLRSLLRAALGPTFRLCGIRPPRARVSPATRAVFTISTGLHYLGSNSFELEAGDRNWLARLLASYARAPFVVIDVRDITVHVEDEIRLSFMAMGPARTMFIVDDRPGTDWRAYIAGVLHIELASLPAVQLLTYPGDQAVVPENFVREAHAALHAIPCGNSGIPREAVVFAKSRVSEAAWKTKFWETDAAQLAMALGVVTLASLGWWLVTRPGGSFSTLPVITANYVSSVPIVFGFVCALPAWVRTHRQLKLERQMARITGCRPSRWRSIAILCLLCLSPGFALIGGPVLTRVVEKIQITAQRTVDSSNLRLIGHAALIWSSERNGTLPPVNLTADGRSPAEELATIHAVATALARDGNLNDSSVWFARIDRTRLLPNQVPNVGSVLDPTKRPNPGFTSETVLAWDFVTGLSTQMASSTPVAWTRGLRTDGTWDPAAAVYGDEGGLIVFLGGNVQFFRDLHSNPPSALSRPTTNILELLPAGARVVGAGPGTLHGQYGKMSQ